MSEPRRFVWILLLALLFLHANSQIELGSVTSLHSLENNNVVINNDSGNIINGNNGIIGGNIV